MDESFRRVFGGVLEAHPNTLQREAANALNHRGVYPKVWLPPLSEVTAVLTIPEGSA